STINGVMIPETSAGSNHTGASETCTPHVSCPSGVAATAEPGAPATRPNAARVRRSRRLMPAVSTQGASLSRPRTNDCILILQRDHPCCWVYPTLDQLLNECLLRSFSPGQRLANPDLD